MFDNLSLAIGTFPHANTVPVVLPEPVQSLAQGWARQQQMRSHRHHHDSPLQFNPGSELDFWRAIGSWSWDPDADVLPSWLSWWLESVFSSCVSSFSSWLKSFSSSLSSFFSCWSSCWVASPASSSFAAFASSLATACAGCWGLGRGSKCSCSCRHLRRGGRRAPLGLELLSLWSAGVWQQPPTQEFYHSRWDAEWSVA